MLKAKLSENFISPNICEILTFYGPCRSGGTKSSDFTSKSISLCESTSFEPFYVKVRWGLTPRAETEKVRKSRTGLPRE